MLVSYGSNFDICCFKAVAFTTKRNWSQFCSFTTVSVLLAKIVNIVYGLVHSKVHGGNIRHLAKFRDGSNKTRQFNDFQNEGCPPS